MSTFPTPPAGWSIWKLQDIASKPIVYGIVQAGPQVDGGVPYIKSTDVGGDIDIDKLSRTSVLLHKKYGRSQVSPGDIVFSLRGNIGDMSIVPDGLKSANLTQGTARISVPRYSNKFIKLQLECGYCRRHISKVAKGSTFQEISLEELRNIRILLPDSASDQDKIAEHFAYYDKSSSIIVSLIEAKERRHQALAQRLLLWTSHAEHWPVAPLGEFFARVRRKNAASCQRVLTASGQHGLVDQGKYFNKSVAGENLTNYTRLVRGEFAYNRSAMNGYPCGAVKRLTDYDEGVVSPLYICLALEESRGDSDFFCHYFESGVLGRELSRIVQVGARSHGMLNISATDLLALDVRVPSLSRQREIAAILNDADREIALYRAELEALKRQKRGLMQQLLTGKVRVP